MTDQLVCFERDGASAIITINRESKLNALNRTIFDAFMAYLDEVERDESLCATIITGTGRAFCAGADIREYWQKGQGAFNEFQRRGRHLNDHIEQHPKPIIAAVNGFAFGGGFELALACDLIIAGEQAQFALPEPSLGLVPGGGGTQRLPRIVGKNRAKELLMTGRRLSAQEAYAWGIVNEVVPPGEEIRTAGKYIGEMKRQAPLAIYALKRLVNEGMNSSLETALSYEQQTLAALYSTADGQEGTAAFIEKRSPTFRGE